MPDTPDAGLAGPSMPSPRRSPAEEGWRDAFLALELETPAGDGWPRLAARLPMAGTTLAGPAPAPATRPLDARRRRRAVAAWALAATVALAIGIAVPRLDTPEPAARMASKPSAALPARGHGSPGPGHEASSPPPGLLVAGEPANADRRPDAAEPAVVPAATHRRVRDAGASRVGATATRAPAPVDAHPAPTAPAFDRLYEESARLEAVVALARDDGMSSATAAAMTTAIDARIGGIDASLSEPGLLPDARLQLWQARVDALRDLAGLETTQRLMAAQGRDYDATLVRVD